MKTFFVSFCLFFCICSCNSKSSDNSIDEATIQNALKPNDSLAKVQAQKAAKEHDAEMEFLEKTPGNTDDAFEKIHISFEGMPEIETVKPMLEAVMTRYNIVINNDHVLKCANVLVAMKNASNIGVTEMDVLKDMYQKGSSSVDFATQAAISATYLEDTR